MIFIRSEIPSKFTIYKLLTIQNILCWSNYIDTYDSHFAEAGQHNKWIVSENLFQFIHVRKSTTKIVMIVITTHHFHNEIDQ